jgi:hypothetical protein
MVLSAMAILPMSGCAPNTQARSSDSPDPSVGAKPASVEAIKAQIDLAKLVITLSSGAVAFIVTFLEKFVARAGGVAIEANCWVISSWVLFAVAIFFALFTLMALVGTLDAIDRKANGWPASGNKTEAAEGNKTEAAEGNKTEAAEGNKTEAAEGDDQHTRWSAILMFVAFFVGVVLMIMAGTQI